MAKIFNGGTGASLMLVRRQAADNVCLGITANDRHIRIVAGAVPLMTLGAGINQLVYVSCPGTGGERKAEQTDACQQDKSGGFLRLHVNLLVIILNRVTIIFLTSISRKDCDSHQQHLPLCQSIKIMLLSQKHRNLNLRFPVHPKTMNDLSASLSKSTAPKLNRQSLLSDVQSKPLNFQYGSLSVF
jgi:hypothetical protein